MECISRWVRVRVREQREPLICAARTVVPVPADSWNRYLAIHGCWLPVSSLQLVLSRGKTPGRDRGRWRSAMRLTGRCCLGRCLARDFEGYLGPTGK
jgi:hypothetical protein